MFGYVAIDEDGGDSALKAHLTIDSKADLDRPGTRAAAEFEDLRIDFVEWQEQTFGPIEG
jgi:hypothetical protein